MKQSFWDRKIPTLIALLIITLSIAVTTFLVRGGSFFQIKAGPEADPENIQITNISDAAFTVSYTTDDEVIGTLNFGSEVSLLDSVVLDDRDQLSQSVNKYKAHSITLRNLDPETTYYFTITSADKKYLKNNSPYKAKTGGKVDKDPSSQVPLSGRIALPDGSFPSDGLVYVNIDEAQKLSTYIKNDGTYILPLNSIRNLSLSDYLTIDANSIIGMEIYSQDLFSSVSVSPNDISPVPLISLSSTYDFSNALEESSSSNPQTSRSGVFPTFGAIKKLEEPQILTPSSDEEFNDPKPMFSGTAVPNETVQISIHSDENIEAQITVGGNGRWTYSPPKELSAGQHTITITTKDKQGMLKTITKNFTVFAAPTSTIQPVPTAESGLAPTSPPQKNSFAIIATVAALFAAAAGIFLFFLIRRQRAL